MSTISTRLLLLFVVLASLCTAFGDDLDGLALDATVDYAVSTAAIVQGDISGIVMGWAEVNGWPPRSLVERKEQIKAQKEPLVAFLTEQGEVLPRHKRQNPRLGRAWAAHEALAVSLALIERVQDSENRNVVQQDFNERGEVHNLYYLLNAFMEQIDLYEELRRARGE